MVHSWAHFRFTMLFISALLFLLEHFNQANAESCDYFQGSWVLDSSYPLYNSTDCPFLKRAFNCQNNGRPDHMYQQYRWQPLHCQLSRFDGREFLQKLKGKSILFVGDSLSQNHWESLICMLYTSVGGRTTKYNETSVDGVLIFTFLEFGVKIMLETSTHLVDIVKEKNGRMLKLDSIERGKVWKGLDMVIFNTWHWWSLRGIQQPWDYIRVGNKTVMDMDRMVAFEMALNTWAKWVEDNIDPAKTTVFFQGISPSHYNDTDDRREPDGTDWPEPIEKSCFAEKDPVMGTTYPGAMPPAAAVVKKVLNTTKKPVKLLDITHLSQLRKDGHPSIYGLAGIIGENDCRHWCLPGVADTWNLLLFNLILQLVN